MADNSILPNVRNLSQNNLASGYVSKGKRVSVYFDRDEGRFVGLEESHLAELKQAYQSVNVDAELKKMALWLVSKGKKRKGDIGFILNWLNNATPSHPPIEEQIDFLQRESPLQSLINDYLRELWKGREYLLDLNSIRKKV